MADKGSKEHWMNRAYAWDRKLLGRENKTINEINKHYKSSFNEIQGLLAFLIDMRVDKSMTLAEAQKVLEPIDYLNISRLLRVREI